MGARKQVFLILGFFFLSAVLVAYAQDAKTDHATMKKEHEKAHAEHDAWDKQIVKWRVEHIKAIASLREIESRILGHEASLEELAGHVADHEDHIRHHEEEIADHEKGGKGSDHAKLGESHKQVMAEHAALAKQVNSFDDDHDKLVAAIQKLREQLPKKP
jgi:molybdenum-dependent DNA-binding transcriptional regulator ModE